MVVVVIIDGFFRWPFEESDDEEEDEEEKTILEPLKSFKVKRGGENDQSFGGGGVSDDT